MRRHPQRSSNALQINIVHAFCAGGPRSPKTIGIWNRSRSPRETFDCHKYSSTRQRNLLLANGRACRMYTPSSRWYNSHQLLQETGESAVTQNLVPASSAGEKAAPQISDSALRNLLSFRGRINRASFLLRNALGWVVFVAFVIIRSLSHGLFLPQDPVSAPSLLEMLLAFLGEMLFLTASLWILFAAWARRWHDLGLFGGLSLLLLLPGVDAVVFVILVFIPGTAGPNRYGPAITPVQNPTEIHG
jgi:uncharacterized membrane protein YhaH (DUF805 family)